MHNFLEPSFSSFCVFKRCHHGTNRRWCIVQFSKTRKNLLCLYKETQINKFLVHKFRKRIIFNTNNENKYQFRKVFVNFYVSPSCKEFVPRQRLSVLPKSNGDMKLNLLLMTKPLDGGKMIPNVIMILSAVVSAMCIYGLILLCVNNKRFLIMLHIVMHCL